MAGRKRKPQCLDDGLDIQNILEQAKHRWLSPAEICQILRNYEKFSISSEPAFMPQSGNLFLYDRKVLRSFRKDGHRWKKTKDGKAVKEAHERLKVGGVEVLHCYYAHGEENEMFQRRSYWMLEKDLSHIALVHYREIQISISSGSSRSDIQMLLQAIDAESLNTDQKSEFKNDKSAYSHQVSPRVQPFLETQQPDSEKIDAEFSDAYCPMAHSNNQQIFAEAKHRWLHPAEICEILQNYEKFHISSEPANLPPDGSLFLFNRKMLRYFRKDGHNWRKKEDGKTVTEANERLKVGGVNLLHCYYAHGEKNRKFQRRIYSMLKEDLSHIVLVHYREVKGYTTKFIHVKETEEVVHHSKELEMKNSASSSFNPRNCQMLSQAMDAISLTSVQASEIKDAESAGGHQEKLSTIPAVNFSIRTQACNRLDSNYAELTYNLRKDHELTSWNTVESENEDDESSVPLQVRMDSHMVGPSLSHDQLFSIVDFSPSWTYENSEIKTSDGSSSWPMDQSLQPHAQYSVTTKPHDGADTADLLKSLGPFLMDSDKPNDLQYHLTNTDTISMRNEIIEGKADYPSAIKPLLDGSFGDGLKKLDSFYRWMTNELEDVGEPQLKSSSEDYWNTVESENEVDESSVPLQVRMDSYMLGPSLSHDQLFSSFDFSPSWTYENSEIKVLITGRFLKSQHAESCKWSCMFGEVEVPAEFIADGVLRCYTPLHKAGRVPFYVTCSGRLACSEVREFEYRVTQPQDVDTKDCIDFSDETLSMRFGNFLSLSLTSPNCDPASIAENYELNSKITSLLKNDNDEWDKMLQLTTDEDFSLKRVEEQLLQQLLQEKLHAWLLQKLAAGGKGPNVLDEGGQGVLHFGAALGYDWVLLPTITAGVSVNFRDVNGWTALHWAAYCGRERTVASLINLGADPGALTDPTTKHPSGETPADLASEQGHKGIAGYLAESNLSKQLEDLNLDLKDRNSEETSGAKAVSGSSRHGELTDGLSLRDSLTAVCNPTQAAARIHQVLKVQSFQRKQLKEYDGDKFGISNERAPSLIAVKSHKSGKRDEDVDAAAIRIQNKFRSWKGRKDFLIIRQRIVKIQAHVRGHQVRKNKKMIVWTVGILEKVILRWRRKGTGLRGFKPEPLTEGPSMQVSSTKGDDDDDILKEGRKQTEERMQKAPRVQCMAQCPEARDQYCRLLNVVTEIQETKVLNSSEEGTSAYMDDDLIDIEALFDDDIFMPTAAS